MAIREISHDAATIARHVRDGHWADRTLEPSCRECLEARRHRFSMAADCITQVTFQGQGFAKRVVARFDLPVASADARLGLTERLAACLDDAREPPDRPALSVCPRRPRP